MIFNKF